MQQENLCCDREGYKHVMYDGFGSAKAEMEQKSHTHTDNDASWY